MKSGFMRGKKGVAWWCNYNLFIKIVTNENRVHVSSGKTRVRPSSGNPALAGPIQSRVFGPSCGLRKWARIVRLVIIDLGQHVPCTGYH